MDGVFDLDLDWDCLDVDGSDGVVWMRGSWRSIV